MKKKNPDNKDWNIGTFASGHFDAWDEDLIVGAFTIAEADVIRGALLAYSRSNKLAGPMAAEVADVLWKLRKRNEFMGVVWRNADK